jgi:hypothetical protein
MQASQLKSQNPCVHARHRITVMNLILEYVLANAAVARSFSGYFANLIGKDSLFFIITPNGTDLALDFWAFALVLAGTALLCYSMRESATFNLGARAMLPSAHPICLVPCLSRSASRDVGLFIRPLREGLLL